MKIPHRLANCLDGPALIHPRVMAISKRRTTLGGGAGTPDDRVELRYKKSADVLRGVQTLSHKLYEQ